MKAATLRIFLSVHTWVGLVSGMFLFIAFYAGSISVFVHELQGWERPAQTVLSPAESLSSSQALLDRVLREHPKTAEGLTLVLPGEHGPRPSAYWYDASVGAQRKFVLEDDGAVKQLPGRGGFVEFIYDLHFTAGLPRSFGLYVFGVVCILYGLALVSGVVIYAPAFLRDLFALRAGRNIKRFWQDAHNVVGVLSLPFHVIFAWSGAVLTIGFLMLAPFQFMVFENKLLTVLEADFELAPHVEPAGFSKPMLSVAELVRRADLALPGLTTESLFYHDAGDANVQVTTYGAMPQRTLNGFGGVAMNGATGEIIKALGPNDFPPGMAMLRGLQTLHYGNFGGFAVKWLYFLLGMMGAFLFYSGNLLWIEARRKRRQVEQPHRTRFVASLTIGVCLGSVAGISAVFLSAALLPDVPIAKGYFTVFFIATIWAFLRRPAKAACELLWVCALLTLAIPVAGWLASGEHLFAALLHGHWHRALIDTTAIILAVAFWRMAVATRRRSSNGDPNSLWALQ